MSAGVNGRAIAYLLGRVSNPPRLGRCVNKRRESLVAGQDGYHLAGQTFGPFPQLFPAQVLNGVFGEYGGIIGGAPHLCHSLGGGNEPVGADSGRGQTGLFYVNSVVHTARTARASIPDGYDHRVAVVRQLLNGRRVGRAGGAGFAVPLHLGYFVAGTQRFR